MNKEMKFANLEQTNAAGSTTLAVAVTVLPHGEGIKQLYRATSESAGFDLAAAISKDTAVERGARQLIPCGISLVIPSGYEAQIRPRSGLALHHGVTVLNSPGTIDSDYRGEIMVLLINHGEQAFTLHRGDRCAQLVFARVIAVEFAFSNNQTVAEVGAGARMKNGFGSSQINSVASA